MRQRELDQMYMRIALTVSEYSYAVRKKVGSVIVTRNGMVSIGMNGTLPGFPNVCENEDGTTNSHITLHAEQNCMFKLLREGVSSAGATLYVTMLPCADECAKFCIAAGISRVVYLEEYRKDDSKKLFAQAGIQCQQLTEHDLNAFPAK